MVKTKCEVYSRVVGYIRPVSNWNDSKQQEFIDRKKFDEAVREVEAEANKELFVQDFLVRANSKKIVVATLGGQSKIGMSFLGLKK